MGIFILVVAGALTGYAIFRVLGSRLSPVWLVVILVAIALALVDLGMVDSPLGLRLPGPKDDPYAELGEVYFAWLFGLPFVLGGVAGVIHGRIVAVRKGEENG